MDGALSDAADSGDGWTFRQLRHALHTARLTRTSPWQTLGQLGAELHVTELAELAASLSLAGTEGSKIRGSLEIKASALRTRLSTEAEAEANAATERMTLPVALLAIAFIIFVLYPAMTQATAAL